MSELKHPYYIVSPDYRESSGGIQALHKLCHQINLRGGSAWMVGSHITNPKWNTPILDINTYNLHKRMGLVPVAVYPEIYSGNILNAEVCVRYMLNHEALLNGNRLNESEEDIFFWYSSQLIVKEPEVDFLTMVGPDLDMFYDDGRTRKTKLLYLNRVPEDAVDFASLPADIILISVKNPRPLEELAEILKSAIVMYTFEWSGTCNLAALSGVPVVSLIAPGYEKFAISEASIRDMGGAGVCFSDNEKALQDTRKEIYKVREHMQKFEADFSSQLAHFFDKTQSAAQAKKSEKYVPLEKWLRNYPTDLLLQRETAAFFSFMTVLLGNGKKDEVEKTLLSLAPFENDVYVYSMPPGNNEGENCASFNDWITDKLAQNKSQWVLFIHAGDIIYPDILSNIFLFKDKINTSLAFYSDRVAHYNDGRREPHFLCKFDLDCFLDEPERFSRGTFFRREVCYEIVTQRRISSSTVEFDFLLQLANANLESDIQHIPLPLLEVKIKKSEFSLAKKALLTEHLSLKGYDHASFEEGRDGSYTICYNSSMVKKITVVMIIDNEVDLVKRTLATFVDSVKNIDYEIIIIDNFTNNADVKMWLTSIANVSKDVFRVYFADEKMSAVKALNFAFTMARGEFTLHLAYGVYFKSNGWLEALMNHCSRSEVQTCAPALIDNQNNFFFSGMINGRLAQDYEQYNLENEVFERPASKSVAARRFLLLSVDCIMIRTAFCHEAGGFDELLPNIQQAVWDLLLRTAGAKNINLCVPSALVHFENALSTTEQVVMDNAFLEKWLKLLAKDPGYNINLSFENGSVGKENDSMLLSGRLGFELRALFIPGWVSQNEVARYNELSKFLNQFDGLRSTVLDKGHPVLECYRIQPKNIVLSDVMAYEYHALFKNKISFPESRFIIQVTERSFIITGNKDCNKEEVLRNADAILVRNAIAVKKVNLKNVYLYADKLSADWAALPQPDNLSLESFDKPRVGIVLAGLQPEDWKHIDCLIKEMRDDVCWIIYGACPESWKPYISEYHRKVPQNRLKNRLQSLRLTLALAPLSHNQANQAEGHRTIIQLGACGYPVLASDHEAYGAIKSAELIKNKTSQWRYMINKIIKDEAYCRQLSKGIYNEVNSCWIYNKDDMPVWLS